MKTYKPYWFSILRKQQAVTYIGVVSVSEYLLFLDQYKPCDFFTHEGYLFEVILN